MRKIVIEIKKPLKKNEVLLCRGDYIGSTEIHELLPDLEELKILVKSQSEAIQNLTEQVASLLKEVKELRGEEE